MTIGTKVDAATTAAGAKADEASNAAKAEVHKSIAKDSDASLGTRARAAGDYIADNYQTHVQYDIGSAQQEAPGWKEAGDYTAKVDAATGAASAKVDETTNAAKAEIHKEIVMDSEQPIGTRVRAAGDYIADKWNEMTASGEKELNKEELKH
ncbi:hypothetical protein CAOG_01414 [Capsaspora owczarzaki ATCC 30864]|uniref:hypothetical protein n=1 Tax=Capsaspora owczarzaki (strain ATCC 30864) TaxID=595528 RepID=UPI0001FE369F|nr:hypothetical protein CAOG_01414 [Capsaspora owczarzaki ATCC 30864]|eukprot:XP_004349934.1 hypothetical protein CAOG_01414 [Capsaspora owczarzaki ATCC 30864]